MIVGCQNCCEPDLFRAFEILNEDYIPGASTVQEYDDELDTCPKCRKQILINDYIILDKEDFISEATNFLANVISSNIKECQNCNWTIIPHEQQHGDSLNLKLVSNLVSEYELSPELEGVLYEKIYCSCGNRLNSDDPYVSEDDLNDWFGEEEIEFIINTFDISAQDTEDFITFLQHHPMLGLEHHVGRTILNKIKKGSLKETEIFKKGSIFYRGRNRNKFERLVPFIEKELWHPPIGLPRQGRYNPPGVPYLYLANSINTVMNEINPSKNDVVDVGELVTLKEFKVFNSTLADIDIFASMENEHEHHAFSYEYIFTNFLSQCLAYCGFNGIAYKSVKSKEGLNLCLFNFTPDTDIEMKSIHTNVNIEYKEDPFGILPKSEIIEIEKKDPSLLF
ncbi:hypothetical protein COI88_28165 [Bacillus cereus]|nr:hypothetical protein COI88_28165 [Bacillus cereus]